MALRHSRWVIAAVLVAVASSGGMHQARAETLVQSNLDTRTALALRVDESSLQKWLPAPWQVAAVPAGPSKGANLLVVFVDRILGLDADGKADMRGSDRGLAMAVPASDPQTGRSRGFNIRVFTANAFGVPGPYKTAVQATVRREQQSHGKDLDPGTGGEFWEIRNSAGGVIELRIEYRRQLPVRSKLEQYAYSAIEPDFFRIYRVDQAADIVKSASAGIDRLRDYRLRVTVAELRDLFDGQEQLISLTIVPWYARQIFLP